MIPAPKRRARLDGGVLRRPGSLNLYALLASLPIIGLLPLVAFAALLLYLLWNGQQHETRRDLQQTVRTLSVAVDREIAASVRRLEVLARLPAWQFEDLADLHGYLRQELAANDDWLNIALVGDDGRLLLNAALPPDAPLPEADRPHTRQVLATGRPAVSDLYQSLRTGDPSIAVAVPVLRDGTVRRVLIARLNPAALSRLLAEQQLRAQGVATVYDRGRRVVARSRDIDRFFGRMPPPEFLASLGSAESGTVRPTPTLDGIEAVGAWQRLPFGWSVSIGVPAAVYQSSLERSLKWLGLIGLVLLVVQVLITVAVAQRLVDEVQSVGEEARRLAAGQAPAPRRSFVRQFDTLRRSLYRTGQRLGRLLESERRARAEAEAASRGKDEFIAMLGHELRNPLAAIGNASRLLARDDLPGQAHGQAVTMLLRQTEHMRRLVDDLLDVGRVLSGKVSLVREPLELRTVIEQALATLRSAGQLGRHALHAELEPVRVDGDAVRLEQVVVNLVNNAVKYTPEGGSIHIWCGREGDAAVVRVRDNGVGMTPELLAHAFDLFVQGDQELHRASGGLGIGLTLTRRLVEMHGGRVVAESPGPGQGSIFTVRLPAVAS